MARIPYQPLTGQKPVHNADCLVRAISAWLYDESVLGWQKAVCFAAKMSMEEHIFPPNRGDCITNYFRHHGCKVKSLDKRRTVGSIAKANTQPILITTKDHIVFAKNGHFYDSWDSSRTIVREIIFLDTYDANLTKIWTTDKVDE